MCLARTQKQTQALLLYLTLTSLSENSSMAKWVEKNRTERGGRGERMRERKREREAELTQRRGGKKKDRIEIFRQEEKKRPASL